jgi:signal transduction histidine kinase
VAVNGRTIPLDKDGSLYLPPTVENLQIVFGKDSSASNPPVRLRWQLDGYQQGWHDTRMGEMRMVLRFSNDAGEIIAEKSFDVSGQTPGWTGRFEDCDFVKRRETVIAPPGTTRLWIVISSAGPPESVGVYVVRNLVSSQPSVSPELTRLIPAVPHDTLNAPPGRNVAPEGWIRDGLRLDKPRVIPYGENGEVGLAIVDDAVDGHADWATRRSEGIPDVAGEPLILEWEEAYSISVGDYVVAGYTDLPAGLYRFRMGGFTVMGIPTGAEVSIPVTVPVPLWQASWFWSVVLLTCVAFGLGVWRFTGWRRMARQVKAMERDRAIEQERVRIAQDIHDDLGARVTQISLLSSSARQREGLSKEAQQDFEAVFQLSRSMVTALYETVWAVEPDNDHLDELGAYICQMSTQMCSEAKLKCRLTVPDLPRDIPLGSKVRHEIIMAVKEAVHNAIRHSGASEIHIALLNQNGVLSITVSDNGSGFEPESQSSGSGLTNMKRRMESCKGTCNIRSRSGKGTQVQLEISLIEK